MARSTVRGVHAGDRHVVAGAHLPLDTKATELEVRFAAEGGGTRVELEHRGWEIYAAEAAETQKSYDTGWDEVLGYHEQKLNG
jgi:hypothetical protein